MPFATDCFRASGGGRWDVDGRYAVLLAGVAPAEGAGAISERQGDRLQLWRWAALTRGLDDGSPLADNNWAKNRISPIALGRNSWLFAGSLRAGKRVSAVINLIQSARLNRLDPWVYPKDVLGQQPTHPANRVAELLPHRRSVTTAA